MEPPASLDELLMNADVSIKASAPSMKISPPWYALPHSNSESSIMVLSPLMKIDPPRADLFGALLLLKLDAEIWVSGPLI